MFPKLITIGNFFIPTYGVLVALGFLAGLWMTNRLAKRSGVNAQRVTDLAIYCAIAGVIGAKLLLIALEFDEFRRNPSEVFSLATLQAGGVFSGGFLAALLVAVWYMRKHQLPGLMTADIFAPGLALGHAIGRLGCFSAGCCYGVASDRPWAVIFTNKFSHEAFSTPINIPVHPTQLYEAFAELVIFGLLLWRFGKPHAAGQIIGWYLMLYSVARVWIEFYRFHEQAPVGPLTVTQWIGVGLFFAGLWLINRTRNRTGAAQPVVRTAR
ncbi:MAG: prolipoprotein diacylglyceryl transferase [Bryobacterales bacterium]|nr:prolipoprotein diacylglyceryl transferase [Bryobacterales bacterium]